MQPSGLAARGLALPHTKGKVAVQHHTARFRLVPSLAKQLKRAHPPERKPRFDLGELPAGRQPAGRQAHPSGGRVVLTRPGRRSASDFTIRSIRRRISALNGPTSNQ